MMYSSSMLPVAAKPAHPKVESGPELWAEDALEPTAFSQLRRRLMLEGCKWDPQVGDVNALAPFPLAMKSKVWQRLAAQAEQLAAETIAAEDEILQRPELLDALGLPRALRAVLAAKTDLTPASGRVMRFDFHLSTEGWKISEVNSDVPGGFSEASYFTDLMAGHFPKLHPAGNPAERWSQALAAAASPNGTVAFLSAPGYLEDYQVTTFLAGKLRKLGCHAVLAAPGQIAWRDGIAHLETGEHRAPLAVIVKFYQAEWLARLPHSGGWHYLFRGGKTRVANPAPSVISESKRFPLLWDKLATPLPTWRALLPETRDPRHAPWSGDDWLLKTAMCNTGDTVCIRELMPPTTWWRMCWSARLAPGKWLAQRQFQSVPISTPIGPRHACVGIYVINGQSAGAYVRISEQSIINFAAVDAVLLLEDDE